MEKYIFPIFFVFLHPTYIFVKIIVKILFCIVLFNFAAQKLLSQYNNEYITFECKVSFDTLLYKVQNSQWHLCQDTNHCNIIFRTIGFPGYIPLRDPFFLLNNYSDLYFRPTKAGQYKDTIIVEYYTVSPRFDCPDCPGEPIYVFLYINITVADTIAGLVKTEPKNNFIFEIYPNPSSDEINLFCELTSLSPIHLHIFDELGREVMTVFDGMMNEPRRDFSFKLPPGLYYVRMETAEGVMTKKVVVE